MKLRIYKDTSKQWRWRLVARNGNILADSGESYTKRSECIKRARQSTGRDTVQMLRNDIALAVMRSRGERRRFWGAVLATIDGSAPEIVVEK